MATLTGERYVTFRNIDCEANAQRVISRIYMHIDWPVPAVRPRRHHRRSV